MPIAASPAILICEDDYLIATDLAQSLTELGAIVVGTANNAGLVRQMAEASELRFNAAVLDVNLGGEMVFPVAELLAQRGVALVFYSGYVKHDVPPNLNSWPFVQKPADASAVLRAITAALTPAAA